MIIYDHISRDILKRRFISLNVVVKLLSNILHYSLNYIIFYEKKNV